MPLVVEDRVQRGEIAGLGIQPRIEVLRLDVDDRAVVAGGGEFVAVGRQH